MGDSLVLLVAALVIDAGLGDPPWLWRQIPHPVALLGGVIGWFEHHLNRPYRPAWDLRLRGALLCFGLVFLAILLGLFLDGFCRHSLWGALLEMLLLWSLLAQNSLYRHVRAVAVALDQRGLAAGRIAVAQIVGREPESLDEFGVARAAIESCAENFADGVVAPVFWALLFGLPGILAYKTANTLDSMIGHLSPRYRAFGMVAARLDDVMNLVPARLAGVLLVLAAAFVPGGRPLDGWRVMIRHHGHHRSPNSGWPEAAMAGALGLSLAGPRHYAGHQAVEPWIGDGRTQATPADIRAALSLLVVGCLLNGGLVLGLFLLYSASVLN
ncbi:MAG TPA: cobalamin biosynthesis protein CobD [Rhodospirillaceae bacterium]|nr:cobalamin biosynthesis protein CobD [Rhodospirillaceae bacterium]